jgi:hypothetical protein
VGVAGAVGAAAVGVPALSRPTATIALRQGSESCAALRCKHRNAAAPPGLIPEQSATKSERHAARTAFFSSAVGFIAVAAGMVAFKGGVTVGAAVAGATGGDAVGAAASDAVAFAGPAAAGAAGAAIAFTAVLHDAESLARLRCRHSKASRPPGCTPEQFAMKSERHDARIASRCACVGCCAAAGANVSGTSATNNDNRNMLDAHSARLWQGSGACMAKPVASIVPDCNGSVPPLPIESASANS